MVVSTLLQNFCELGTTVINNTENRLLSGKFFGGGGTQNWLPGKGLVIEKRTMRNERNRYNINSNKHKWPVSGA